MKQEIIVGMVLLLALLSGCIKYEESPGYKQNERYEQTVSDLCSNYTNKTLIGLNGLVAIGRVNEIKTEIIPGIVTNSEYATVYFDDGYVTGRMETYDGWNYRKGTLYVVTKWPTNKLLEC